jgi:hypothetical protein
MATGAATLPLALTETWSTIASLATAAGTLVLAIATFASVRSANRSARVAELALQEQRRPVLVQSRTQDPEQKIMFVDGRWLHVRGGTGAAEHADGNVYLSMSLRNVGAGIGVLQGWAGGAGLRTAKFDHVPEAQFRPQTRDLYIPAGDVGLWQGALRDADDPAHGELARAVEGREPIWLELLYSDQAGGQRTISRFMLVAAGEEARLASVSRHWYLDRDGPR